MLLRLLHELQATFNVRLYERIHYLYILIPLDEVMEMDISDSYVRMFVSFILLMYECSSLSYI